MRSTFSGSPTKPRSTMFSIFEIGIGDRRASPCAPCTMLPSLPDRPTALPPASLMKPTICLLIEPASTISTISMVLASVMRRPPANSRLDAEPLEHLADLRAAAMHHHRIDARSAPSARCRGRSRAPSPPRPWRGRRISPRRSPRRSAACAAAPRTGRGRCRGARRSWRVLRLESWRLPFSGRASSVAAKGRSAPRSASSRAMAARSSGMPAPPRAEVAQHLRDRPPDACASAASVAAMRVGERRPP